MRDDQGVDFAPWAFAAVKAAVSAKFMLIGSALKIGEGYKKYPLIVPTLYKSVAFVGLAFSRYSRRLPSDIYTVGR
jgi:hypothetical protein